MRLASPLLCLSLLVPTAALVATACGGKTGIEAPPGDGGSSSGSHSGSSSGGCPNPGCPQADCPASPPDDNSACDSEGLTCGGSMWSGVCPPRCTCTGGAWVCTSVPCVAPSCPASEPTQYSPCYVVGASCSYANAGTCACESPGTWFCNTGAGGSSGGGSGSSSGGGNASCAGPAPAGCFDCICDNGQWDCLSCSYDGGAAFDATLLGD
jgi:hypothetical protein